jgi:hypothetical protein
MKNLFAHINQQFNRESPDTQINSDVAVTETYTRFVARGPGCVWAGSYQDGMGRGFWVGAAPNAMAICAGK